METASRWARKQPSEGAEMEKINKRGREGRTRKSKTNRDRAKANRNFKEQTTRLRDVTIEMIVSMETVRQEITERETRGT